MAAEYAELDVPDGGQQPAPNFFKRHKKLVVAGILTLCVVGGLVAVIVVKTVPASPVAAPTPAPLPTDPYLRAEALQRLHPLADGHNDLPEKYREKAWNNVSSIDLTQLTPEFDTDIPKVIKGILGIQFWSVYVSCTSNNRDAVRATMEQIDVMYDVATRYPNHFRLVAKAADAMAAFQEGVVGGFLGIEGGHQIDSSLGALRMFYKLGVRYMTLTHNCNTPWSTSCCDPNDSTHAGGITDFGRAVVREMNRLGMLVDLAHTSPNTMKEAIAASVAPVIFSHSNAAGLWPNPRNVPDDVLPLVQANGGVIMVTFVPGFLKNTTLGDATSKDVADHIDYFKAKMGIDHVGIGADYDGISSWPVDLRDVSKYPVLTAELISRGYTDEDVIQVLGGNILRALTTAETIAAQLQATTSPGYDLIPPYNQTLRECRTFIN